MQQLHIWTNSKQDGGLINTYDKANTKSREETMIYMKYMLFRRLDRQIFEIDGVNSHRVKCRISDGLFRCPEEFEIGKYGRH